LPCGVTPSRIEAVIGLGANLGDRRAALVWAVRRCADLGQLIAVSSLYETDPVGGPPQPDFLNAAVRLSTVLGPEPLFARLLELERRAGRERRERWGPRTLDLDLLWIRGLRLDCGHLRVPHPHLESRPFALMPLVEVAPDAAHPDSGTAYAAVLQGLDTSGVRVAEPGSDWVPNDA
jgi:2-amino-4-hydroxy-6-hydroxymethyldihydropteridine diphosphokinase